MEKIEVKTPKTMICNWCNKRKLFFNGYWFGKCTNNKNWFICEKCNLIHDIV